MSYNIKIGNNTFSGVSKLKARNADDESQYCEFNETSGNINITNTSSINVKNYATAQVVDENLVAGNIKKDVTILGTTGTYEGAANHGFPAVIIDYRYYTMSYTATSYLTIGGYTESQLIGLCQSNGSYISVDGYNWKGILYVDDIKTITGTDITTNTTDLIISYTQDYNDCVCYVYGCTGYDTGTRLKGTSVTKTIGNFSGSYPTGSIYINIGYDD